MHPVILELPFGISIKAYGLMMMLGFFAATWWAMYRAQKVKADADVILNLGFISLVSGIVGARLLYVVQFWEKDFANQPNPLAAALNVTSGGLVFYGGFLLAVICALVYLAWAKHSIRLYLDILAPSLMIGLAFGRMGCFLNGCCWGAPTQKVPWAMSFPFGWESTPFMEHWQKGMLNVPEQLLYKMPTYPLPVPIHREHIGISASELQAPQQKLEQAQQALEQARKNKAAPAPIASLEKEVEAAKSAAEKHRKEYYDLAYAYERYGLTPSDVAALAEHHRSLPVHPTQLYAIIDAVLIALLLHLVFMWRRQQGMVFGLLFILYAFGRYFEEMIRGDNPATWHLLGMGNFTMSQVISVYTLVFAIVYLVILYRLPATPATAVRVIPAEPQESAKPV
jgi:phosphatidylglycerol:prolipoprotein diacylglycerol transferase